MEKGVEIKSQEEILRGKLLIMINILKHCLNKYQFVNTWVTEVKVVKTVFRHLIWYIPNMKQEIKWQGKCLREMSKK